MCLINIHTSENEYCCKNCCQDHSHYKSYLTIRTPYKRSDDHDQDQHYQSDHCNELRRDHLHIQKHDRKYDRCDQNHKRHDQPWDMFPHFSHMQSSIFAGTEIFHMDTLCTDSNILIILRFFTDKSKKYRKSPNAKTVP